MARTGGYVNTYTFSITPAGGSLTVWTGITDFTPIGGNDLATFMGDNAFYPVFQRAVNGQIGFTVSGYDLSKILQLGPGPHAVSVVVGDSKNGTGSGGLTFAYTNCMRQNAGGAVPNNQPAGASVTFMCFAPDGVTSPLTITEAS